MKFPTQTVIWSRSISPGESKGEAVSGPSDRSVGRVDSQVGEQQPRVHRNFPPTVWSGRIFATRRRDEAAVHQSHLSDAFGYMAALKRSSECLSELKATERTNIGMKG